MLIGKYNTAMDVTSSPIQPDPMICLVVVHVHTHFMLFQQRQLRFHALWAAAIASLTFQCRTSDGLDGNSSGHSREDSMGLLQAAQH